MKNYKHILNDNNVYLFAWIWATTFWDKINILKKTEKYGQALGDIKTFCIFIGYPRSGHSLIGSIIDAHPNAVISHRLDSLKYFSRGISIKEIFYLILQNSKRFAASNRKLTSYQYKINDEWHGKFKKLLVIGDQEGNWSSKRLGTDLELLNKLINIPNVRVRFIHVVRNPYDNITTWALRTGDNLNSRIKKYFLLAGYIDFIKANLNSDQLFEIKHEDFLCNPASCIQQLSSFLGLEASEQYIKDCVSVIYKKPNITRENMKWDPELIQTVKEEMAKFSFFKGYTYDT